ncbi:MAG: thioredoxin domain-containing protein [Saprospiraceae bacterium]
MNQLLNASSDYLKNHASNPVDWFPWGSEALAIAKELDKPILLSIGYSSCHWCHVMNRESFQSEEIARFMNHNFVNIKVDREERPDLDEAYQGVLKSLGSSGGWPLTLFLTPNLLPFFGGTYFGPTPSNDQYTWYQALQYASYNYIENKEAVVRIGNRILNRQKVNLIPRNTLKKNTTQEWINVAISTMVQKIDGEHGGFGTGAKFPNLSALKSLLYLAKKDNNIEEKLFFTLNKMSQSGLYDHVGGGIFRYTTDRMWKIPHFEKMLYDNALYLRLIAEVCKYKNKTKYRRILSDTIGFLDNIMQSPEGTYYSAVDAESDHQEGANYTWSKTDIDNILKEDSSLFCEFHDITNEGNWEGTNIIYQPYDLWDFARKKGIDRIQIRDQFIKNRKQLLVKRQTRTPLFVDKKIILSWNALMVSALAHAHMATGIEKYAQNGLKLIDTLLDIFYNKDTHKLNRIQYQGNTSGKATLRDYSYLNRALLDIYTMSQNTKYLEKAINLTAYTVKEFAQEKTVLFQYSKHLDNTLIDNLNDIFDEEMPSGNATMVGILHDIGLITDNEQYTHLSQQIVNTLYQKTIDSPLHHAELLALSITKHNGPMEISVIGENHKKYASQINKVFLPEKILMSSKEPNSNYPLLQKKQEDKTLIYICQNKSCKMPVDNMNDFNELVDQLTTI